MSKWVDIITAVRGDLNLADWGNVPESSWPTIAQQCGPDEIADIERRLAELEIARSESNDWDGDDADAIWHAEQLFKGVLNILRTS